MKGFVPQIPDGMDHLVLRFACTELEGSISNLLSQVVKRYNTRYCIWFPSALCFPILFAQLEEKQSVSSVYFLSLLCSRKVACQKGWEQSLLWVKPLFYLHCPVLWKLLIHDPWILNILVKAKKRGPLDNKYYPPILESHAYPIDQEKGHPRRMYLLLHSQTMNSPNCCFEQAHMVAWNYLFPDTALHRSAPKRFGQKILAQGPVASSLDQMI